MRTRSARRVGAYMAILAMLFGQLALAAYACASPQPRAPAAMMHATMAHEAGQAPCPAMLSAPDAPTGNACEVHCSDGATSAGQPDCPQVTLAALPAPALALAELPIANDASRTPWTPLPGAPPPTLRFCRLLI